MKIIRSFFYKRYPRSATFLFPRPFHVQSALKKKHCKRRTPANPCNTSPHGIKFPAPPCSFSAYSAYAARDRRVYLFSYTNGHPNGCPLWWEEVDSNHRSRRRQIYSLIHLAALEPVRLLWCSAQAVEPVIGLEPTTC